MTLEEKVSQLQELRAIQRLSLKPGESRPGKVEAQLGASSANARKKVVLTVSQ
jgi:hypothetical protein